ncbi:MAG TPA: elongation factor Ts [Candidatus Taylorbacteria bacterium]|nr:MAG: Elongation factor Ts [Parcubacteria group bacterium GW2011_GWA2_47_64]KKU96982.1 MAG: Elongation factor Ts [Parcubacteria group bacterium GW2011_GWC2_48_17]HBV00882.1 elongation factor Ts [Candidatus Taylorbacteria bacterium]
MVTTEQIKTLRDQTGVSIILCRKALEEANGDIEKAKVVLQRKGADAAEKKASRTLGAGTVSAYIHHGGTVGALVELSSETDFVSGNEAFKALAHDIAMHIAASRPEFVRREDVSEETLARAKEVLRKEVEGKPKEMQEKILEGKLNSYFAERILLEQPFIKNPDQTIRSLIENATQKFGEKIEVTRFARLAAGNRT